MISFFPLSVCLGARDGGMGLGFAGSVVSLRRVGEGGMRVSLRHPPLESCGGREGWYLWRVRRGIRSLKKSSVRERRLRAEGQD